MLPFRFFEGATSVSGTVNGISVTGIGFAELLHDYEDPDVSITYPNSGVYDASIPITWELNNPDDGRPVYYDVAYSIDNQNTFNSIVTNSTSSSFLWTNPSISQNDEVWFRITAYSIDGILNSTVTSSSASSATLSIYQDFFESVKGYPNPSTSIFNIDFGTVIYGNYRIVDIGGRIISSSEIVNVQSIAISTKDLNSGMYFVVIETDKFKTNLSFIKK